MINILDNLSRGHERLGFNEMALDFYNKLIASEFGLSSCYKFMSLLSREYGDIYQTSANASRTRLAELLPKFGESFRNPATYRWNTYKELDEPRSVLEEAESLFYRYEFNTLEKLDSDKGRALGGINFEFVLPEVPQVTCTYKCYKKIRLLCNQLRLLFNKKKFHFRDEVPKFYSAYNVIHAKLVAEEIEIIA